MNLVSNSKLFSVKRQFDQRHDFDDSDLNVLKDRWPNIQFLNIPTAWIVPIDVLMEKLGSKNPISQIRQEFGQFIVLYGEIEPKQKQLISDTEELIYSIDVDLRLK